MNLPRRKNIRLQGYDYSKSGAYFITICSYQRSHVFGEIITEDTGSVGQGLCSCRLSDIGEIIESEIKLLHARYSQVEIAKHVIMPNHAHLLLAIVEAGQEQSPCPIVGDVICALKSITTKMANKQDGVKGRKIWQFRYHDRIIRDEDEYLQTWQYIDENPARWTEDEYYG